jgi:hypothetical protein
MQQPSVGAENATAGRGGNRERKTIMTIWTVLFIILLIAWLGGVTVFHVAGGLIHLLLVLALISLVVHFVAGTRAV